MGSSKFTAIVPNKGAGYSGIQDGDKVLIKGRVTANAEEFSINFVNETCAYPQNITYHFKWILTDKIIVENNKQHGQWMQHMETDFNQLNGRWENVNIAYDNKLLENSDNRTIGNEVANTSYNTTTNDNDDNEHQHQLMNSHLNSLLLGQNFALEFAFRLDGIYVYVMYDDDRNLITRYEPDHDLSSILAVQVWGDVEKVTELSFKYA